jgi:hypothetical protein
LTLSIGAARVLAMAPEVPPIIKSFRIFEVLLPPWELEDGDDWIVIFKWIQSFIK